jgi:hypothetical protein
MNKSIRDIPKKRGRPKTTGRGTALIVRMHEPAIAEIDAWIASQSDAALSRPEAIRQLVQRGLDASKQAPNSAETIAKAKRVAARPVPEKPSPARGEALLKKGLADLTLHKSRKTK